MPANRRAGQTSTTEVVKQSALNRTLSHTIRSWCRFPSLPCIIEEAPRFETFLKNGDPPSP